MRRIARVAVSLVASTAIAASLCAAPLSAFAAGGLSGSVGASTNWKVPSSQMKNYVTVNGDDGKPVPYKVITTWANAWALSGPDYLGVSNSGTLHQQGGGGATSQLATAQSDTLLGIWASSANEVPNAYNWNFFYNMALTAAGETNVDTAAIDVQNGSNAGFDSESGVWAAFKYRPEIIWTSNSLNATNAAKYAALIKSGKYITGNSGSWKVDDVTVKDDGTIEEDKNDSSVYSTEAANLAVFGDSTYKPYIMSANNKSALTFTDSFYELAGLAEAVIDGTKDFANEDADGNPVVEVKEGTDRFGNTTYTVDDSNLTWKNMNYLPRTTRYVASAEEPMTARECALAVEKITRGAVYYTLSQIDDGKVAKKKVAFLTGDPSNGTATVVKYDFIDQIGGGATGGKTNTASLVVDQLTGTEVSSTPADSVSGVSYTTYTVDADALAGCDYVVDANGSMSTNQLQTWVAKNVSSYANKQRALNDVQYLTNSPAIMNGHNFTTEKLIWGAFNISFFYPELFPNMELVAWWYDNIYHLKADSVRTAMQWGLANASLPAETELSALGKGYSTADLDSKFKEGYEYYQDIKGTAPYNTEQFKTLAPSETFVAWAEGENFLKSDIIVKGTNSYSKLTTDKAFSLNAKPSVANAKVTYKSDNTQVATVDANGKVTIKGAGTANITVTASKSRYNSGSLKVAVKVAKPATKQAAQTITAKNVTKTYKGKNKKLAKKKTFKLSASAKTKVTFKKKSGNSKISVTSAGKVTVKKGLKKGTYKVKVKASAAATSAYKAASKTITVKVKIK